MPRIAEVKAQVERIWLATFQGSLSETVTQHVRQHALAGVQAALETALVEERDAYRAAWYQHQLPFTCVPATLPRSGTYTRQVVTAYGSIPNLRVPTLRGGKRERPWQILARYQLAMPDVLDQACALSTLGLSIRDLQEAGYVLCGRMRSCDARNRGTRAVPSPLAPLRQRPLPDTPPILLVAGV
jgi:transposase-like protein